MRRGRVPDHHQDYHGDQKMEEANERYRKGQAVGRCILRKRFMRCGTWKKGKKKEETGYNQLCSDLISHLELKTYINQKHVH